MKKSIAVGILLSSGMSVFSHADDRSFQYKDWEMVCDNTRTCRAAGYSADEAQSRVSVLLTRKAGVNQPVTAQVQLADVGDAEDAPIPKAVDFWVGQQKLGRILLKDAGGDLNAMQTRALLNALKGSQRIYFASGKSRWELSSAGANAVLLKVDEQQGRLNTPSALIRVGNHSEQSVLPALPMPIIHQQKIPVANLKLWQKQVDWNTFTQNLKAQQTKNKSDDQECSSLTSDDEYTKFEPQVEAVLPNNRLLVSGLCWRGAYNEGYGYWIVQQQKPYKPQLITVSASGYEKGVIDAAQKGRGLGDCWWHAQWVWNGQNFVKSSDATTGMCRMILLGGAWDLPSYVSQVK
ncbi:DUF1176 domain-containing protein [Acinetobacter sp. ANC 4640]